MPVSDGPDHESVTPAARPAAHDGLHDVTDAQAGRLGETGWLAGALQRISWAKVVLFMVSLFLFILAIMLMKEGAKGLTPLVQNTLAVNNAANTLGFGWLFAYLIMSGSPVAAAALIFFDAGAISKLGTFTMITGSRLGASFIVLFIGFIYVLRGRDRATSLAMGLLSLTVTGVVHLIGLPIGALILGAGLLDAVQMRSGGVLSSATDLVMQPIVDLAVSLLPGWGLFVVGMVVIIISFALFDRCLPQMTLRESQLGRLSRFVYRPLVMFFLGSVITLISMSVSVSLSILVPLSNRGFVRRENVIPYIMGAGVTTFIDTLLAAVLIGNSAGFTVVLVEMVSVAIVSIGLLVLIFPVFERAMLRIVGWTTARNRNLALFMLLIFVVPVILMLI